MLSDKKSFQVEYNHKGDENNFMKCLLFFVIWGTIVPFLKHYELVDIGEDHNHHYYYL